MLYSSNLSSLDTRALGLLCLCSPRQLVLPRDGYDLASTTQLSWELTSPRLTSTLYHEDVGPQWRHHVSAVQGSALHFRLTENGIRYNHLKLNSTTSAVAVLSGLQQQPAEQDAP